MRIVFIVDDNLIGNKKAIKAVLRDVIAWQRKHAYPLTFFTEASIDLADDPELMELMVEANFLSVFIGIESPREDSLRETKKFQNVRTGGTLLEKVHRIQKAGIEVWCGMIMGFDSDDPTIFDAQRQFIQESRIPFSMMGMLHAIPKTPLHARLAAEGRLDHSDEPEFGTNIIPLQIGRQELRDGYLKVVNDLYDPETYFQRVEDLYLKEKMVVGQGRARYWRRHPLQRIKTETIFLAQAVGLFVRMMRGIPEALPPSGVPQTALAVAEGPPEPGHDPDLHDQLRHALPRSHDGPATGLGRAEARQLVLNQEKVPGAVFYANGSRHLFWHRSYRPDRRCSGRSSSAR